MKIDRSLLDRWQFDRKVQYADCIRTSTVGRCVLIIRDQTEREKTIVAEYRSGETLDELLNKSAAQMYLK